MKTILNTSFIYVLTLIHGVSFGNFFSLGLFPLAQGSAGVALSHHPLIWKLIEFLLCAGDYGRHWDSSENKLLISDTSEAAVVSLLCRDLCGIVGGGDESCIAICYCPPTWSV